MRPAISLTFALATLLGTTAARAACTYECSARVVDRACASAEGRLRGGAGVELIATCSATCSEGSVVARGEVSPTTVPITSSLGEYAGHLVDEGRTCDGARVYQWSAPAETGVYRLGTRELVVEGAPRRAFELVTPEVVPIRTPPRDWDDRHGFALELGASGVGALVGRQEYGAGGSVSFGLHDVRDELRGERGEKFSWPVVRGLRWCAPLACVFPLLLAFAPTDSILGNDRGVDFRAEVLGTDAGPLIRLGVQPVMRYAHGIARTGTLIGMLLPEIAFATGGARPNAIAFAWSMYPVEFLVDRRHLAVGFDPLRAGFRIPLDGSPVGGELRTEISFRWVR